MNTELSYFATGDGVRLAYRFDGAADAPALVLSNSIGTDLRMWDAQIAGLSRRYRVLRYDARGHGASDAPDGAYSLDRLGRDVLELMDGLGIGRAHFLGLSLGGLVGQWLGVRAPERIDRLILAHTSAYFGAAPQWDERIAAVRRAPHMDGIAEQFLRNWFPEAMLAGSDAAVEPFRAMLLATDRRGFAGSYAAVRDADLRRSLALIVSPTLVVAGRDDTATSLGDGEAIAAAVAGARLAVLPAVHLSNVERADEFLGEVLDFLRAA